MNRQLALALAPCLCLAALYGCAGNHSLAADCSGREVTVLPASHSWSYSWPTTTKAERLLQEKVALALKCPEVAQQQGDRDAPRQVLVVDYRGLQGTIYADAASRLHFPADAPALPPDVPAFDSLATVLSAPQP